MADARGLTLKLYVLKKNSNYQEKLKAISDSLKRKQGLHCEIEVVDLNQNPEQAEERQILAIPTLIKEMPDPPLRMVGNIDDIEQIVDLLCKE